MVRRILTIIIAALGLLGSNMPVYALTTEDKKAVIYGTEFYSTVDVDICGVDTSTNLVGSDNTEKTYNFFVGKGLTPVQASAIIGNLMQESTLDPKIVQPHNPGVTNYGIGIAQWSQDDRWQKLLIFAKDQNADPFSLSLQLDYLWHELTTSYKSSLDNLKKQTDIVKAVTQFESDFEGASDPQMQNRIKYARTTLNKYGGGAVAPTGGTTDACGGTGGVGVSGDFTFPMKTTQADIKRQKPLTWCFDSQTSCHHDYVAADIFNDIGTPNIAAVKGTVVKAVDTSCHGGFDVPRIQIKGSDGKYYYYTHMKPGSIRVHDGQSVAAGTVLGVVGPSECAENTQPHLHFQMSSVVINNTSDLVERNNYINPQPNLVPAFNKLPEK